MMDAFKVCRVPAWQEQPEALFDRAIIDADGTIVETLAGCKQGTDFAHEGTFGYQMLVPVAST